MTVRAAVDVGGTFTDVCALDEATGELIFVKDSTTPKDFSIGVLNTIKKSGVDGSKISGFVATGSTMVINAITERKGVKTGLITTKGFRDVLEIQRSNRTDMYNFMYKKPEPLVPRYLRREVRERVDADGTIVEELHEEELEEIGSLFKKEGVLSVAICLYNSYANHSNEERCAAKIQKLLPGTYLSTSMSLGSEWREYERTNTTVMNAYVQPIVDHYLTNLKIGLEGLGVQANLFVMQSNGGISSFEQAIVTPIYQVESGPAGGVIGSAAVGTAAGIRNVISLDVGGTTAKTSLIDDGQVRISPEYNLEKTPFFAGYPLKVPIVDIVEIGAGGGSIVWADEVGSLQVGPISAGADPGPACYDKGGERPTLTDAFVVSGVIDPEYFLGGEIHLRKDLSENAFMPLSRQLGLPVQKLALGAIRIADSNMINMIKLVSVRRGYDPRDFAIIAFGGAGPMFAVDLARDLGIGTVMVPLVPGVFSAWGMLLTDLRHDLVQTKVRAFNESNLGEINSTFDQLRENAADIFMREHVEEGMRYFTPSLDLRYYGQEHTLNTPVSSIPLKAKDIEKVKQKFDQLHHKQFTFSLQDPVEAVNIRLTAYGRVKKPVIKPMKNVKSSLANATKGKRKVVLLSGKFDAKVFERALLPVGAKIRGPVIIEEKTSTTLVGPGDLLTVNKYGHLVINVRKGAL
ncbi:MAG: hydantoinase/oxoprolinase family protein [Candidatus Bathyarchaeia archaeon]|jgi:N-methylhydantoinase A